jgi:hypothetical protein
MKTSVYARSILVASLALAPLAAFSHDKTTSQACVDAFVAQNLPGQTPIIRVDRGQSTVMPLAFGRTVPALKLTAAKLESGAVLAIATCTAKNGVITLTPDIVAASAVIAAR